MSSIVPSTLNNRYAIEGRACKQTLMTTFVSSHYTVDFLRMPLMDSALLQMSI